MLDWLSGIWDFGSKLFQTGYNLFTNKRDFDYQKNLQKEIFEREDTAVKRRMEDLKAAGLNPNLAAGSAAGAGAVVGRSTTNDISVGSALDTIAAKNQLALQRQETENAKKTAKILDEQYNKVLSDNAVNNYILSKQLGIPNIIIGYDNGHLKNGVQSYWQNGKMYTDFSPWMENKDDNYLWKTYEQNLKYLENSNVYLQKELNWYNANQVVNMLTGGIGAVTGAVNAGANVKRASSMLRR